MSNVVPMGQTREFLLTRAARHRRAGRYDEAMALLLKAKDQFGVDEEIELEMAYVYAEIGCDEAAQRAYLRVVRLKGKCRAQALYQLSILSAQNADVKRAQSYFQQLCAMKQADISHDAVVSLGQQLEPAQHDDLQKSRKARARKLERRAVECLQAGKPAAAERDMRHAMALRPSAQGFTMLACCLMVREKYDEAIEFAEIAHELAPKRVQTICVLADACAGAGRRKASRRWMYLAALRAETTEDMQAAAIESAKYGEDALTLRLTERILKREPFHTRAMMLRACALANRGRLKAASRLFGRLCGLTPEDVVCEVYYRMTKDGVQPAERLAHGMDLAHPEGVELAKELLSMLYMPPEKIREDRTMLQSVCRMCFWALRSMMAGGNVKTVALILLNALEMPQTEDVLLDALLDPQVADSVKAGVLQTMTARHGFCPYEVDFGGRMVRLAAGGVSSQPVRSSEMNQKIVQRVSDALSPDFPDAAQMLLPLFLKYMEKHGAPKGRQEDACAAALEYVYHQRAGRGVDMKVIAARWQATARLCGVIARRLMQLGETQE